MDCRDCIYYELKSSNVINCIEHICHYSEEIIPKEMIPKCDCDFFISMEEWLSD